MTNAEKIKQLTMNMFDFTIDACDQLKSLERKFATQLAQMQKELDALERKEFGGLTRIECVKFLGADPLTGFTKQELDDMVRGNTTSHSIPDNSFASLRN